MINNIELNSFVFSITNYCGCKCKHCLVNSGINNKKFFLKEDIFNICNQLKDLKMLENKPIALTGGELSFHKDIFDIISGIRDIGFNKINLSLTGMGFNEENIKNIAPLINIACFSIDGNEEFHNLFRGVNIYEKTLNNISLFKKYGTKNIAIQMSIYKENIKYIDHIINLANSLGIYHVRLIPILPIGRAKVNLNNLTLLNEYDYENLLKNIITLNGSFSNISISSILDRKNYLRNHPECVYGLKSIKNFEVNQDGDMFFNGLIDKKFCIGNIFENNIKDLINGFFEGYLFKKYNDISKKIYMNKVLKGTHETICIYKEKIIAGDDMFYEIK